MTVRELVTEPQHRVFRRAPALDNRAPPGVKGGITEQQWQWHVEKSIHGKPGGLDWT